MTERQEHSIGWDLSLLGQRTLRAVEAAYEQFGKGILVPSPSEHQGSTKRRSPGCFESSDKLRSSQRICQSPPGSGDTKKFGVTYALNNFAF